MTATLDPAGAVLDSITRTEPASELAPARPNTLLLLTALAMSQPGPDAAATQVAAWYLEKARIHEILASQAPNVAERCTELEHAVSAAEHGRRLLLTGVTVRPVPSHTTPTCPTALVSGVSQP